MWSLFENLKLGAEAVALAGILLVFWLHPAVRQALRAPRLRWMAITLAVLFAVEAVAQITTRNQYKYPQTHEPFPFTRWAMFSGLTSTQESVVVYDWRGMDADGGAVVLNPAHLYVTPNACVLFTKTHALGDQIPPDGQAVKPSALVALNAFAEGLLARHNELNPGRPIMQVELWRRTVPLRGDALVPAAFEEPASVLIHTWNPSRP